MRRNISIENTGFEWLGVFFVLFIGRPGFYQNIACLPFAMRLSSVKIVSICFIYRTIVRLTTEERVLVVNTMYCHGESYVVNSARSWTDHGPK